MADFAKFSRHKAHDIITDVRHLNTIAPIATNYPSLVADVAISTTCMQSSQSFGEFIAQLLSEVRQ